MQNNKFRLLPFLLVLVLLCSFTLTAFAASKNQAVNTVKYNSYTGKSTYVTTTFENIPNKEKVTITTGWGKSFKAVNNKNTGGLKSYTDKVRFDVHIIDPSTNRVVKYYYYLSAGESFKVYSEVPKISAKKYRVRITSYFNNYKTFKGTAKVGWQYGTVASNLKYKITY